MLFTIVKVEFFLELKPFWIFFATTVSLVFLWMDEGAQMSNMPLDIWFRCTVSMNFMFGLILQLEFVWSGEVMNWLTSRIVEWTFSLFLIFNKSLYSHSFRFFLYLIPSSVKPTHSFPLLEMNPIATARANATTKGGAVAIRSSYFWLRCLISFVWSVSTSLVSKPIFFFKCHQGMKHSTWISLN